MIVGMPAVLAYSNSRRMSSGSALVGKEMFTPALVSCRPARSKALAALWPTPPARR
jgi:hypothetical protein